MVTRCSASTTRVRECYYASAPNIYQKVSLTTVDTIEEIIMNNLYASSIDEIVDLLMSVGGNTYCTESRVTWVSVSLRYSRYCKKKLP